MTHSPLSIHDFDYELPAELIARYPAPERTQSRLLCLDKDTGQIAHHSFSAILSFIQPGDLLILNNTKVIPARLFAQKNTGGKVEILIERILEKGLVLAHLKANKSLQPDTELLLENGQKFRIQTRVENLFQLQLVEHDQPVLDVLNEIGHMPLPPYMARDEEGLDQERYQTVYAQVPGAIAAPTAGLHFDESLLQQLRDKKVEIDFVTLHVGAGTFQPVRVTCLTDHLMHAEQVTVSAELCEKIKRTQQQEKRIIAVGTTTVRSLETVCLQGEIRPYQGESRLFIYPGFRFQCVDALITNFHLPKSTLLMLVSAFAGHNAVMNAYRQAITAGYRFFSYGDAMWIACADHLSA